MAIRDQSDVDGRPVWSLLRTRRLQFLLLVVIPTCGHGFVTISNQHNRKSLASPCFVAAADDPEQSIHVENALLDLLSPPQASDVDRMSSTDLAYIGDVVYEMFVRSKKVWPPKRTSDLQQQVVGLVRGRFLLGKRFAQTTVQVDRPTLSHSNCLQLLILCQRNIRLPWWHVCDNQPQTARKDPDSH